jgi:hypothetical protein
MLQTTIFCYLPPQFRLLWAVGLMGYVNTTSKAAESEKDIGQIK